MINKFKSFIFIVALVHCTTNLFSHDLNYDNIIIREWTIKGRERIKGSLLMINNNEVFLQNEKSESVHYPFSYFSLTDQQYLIEHYRRIEKLNGQENSLESEASNLNSSSSYNYILIGLFFLAFFIFISRRKNYRYFVSFSIVSFIAIFYSFRIKTSMRNTFISDPLSIDSAFMSFHGTVITSWDSNYFYVESNGIPMTHGMMTGITKWQQQVPIPQCYIKPNAWMIPLNPVIASTPIPVDSIHFTRGAIAVAVNGIPIFNYHTNTGVDAYLDGQLDQWGGHCGRADDYHYHIAPLQLYNNIPSNMPLAYALDGFAVYGNLEPDGNQMMPLDSNNGHYGNNGFYHYHGIATSPYMIGRMVGVVNEDATHQIIPQPRANPVRPSLTPLNGARITNCTPNSTNNGYTVEYTINGSIDSIVYSWTGNGVYRFSFYTDGLLDSSRNYNGFVQCTLPTKLYETDMIGKYIELYPNPTENEFSLNLKNAIDPSDIVAIKIYDFKGKNVLYCNGFKETFELNQFDKGVYLVEIKTKRSTFTRKVVLR